MEKCTFTHQMNVNILELSFIIFSVSFNKLFFAHVFDYFGDSFLYSGFNLLKEIIKALLWTGPGDISIFQ